jgi:transcriptional regulator with XRE-family HTH domain
MPGWNGFRLIAALINVPLERMAILELRAARGWSARQAAERFHVTATTLGSWKARIDEHGPNALLRIPVPVNKFPDLVRYIVRRLKLLCPRLGKVKIAEMLCRLDCIWRRPPWDASSERIFAGPNRWLSPLHRGRSSRHGEPTSCGTLI